MNVKTGLKAGMGEDDQPDGVGFAPGKPYINKWMTCLRCKGTKDRYGNVSDGSCQACWPTNMKAPY